MQSQEDRSSLAVLEAVTLRTSCVMRVVLAVFSFVAIGFSAAPAHPAAAYLISFFYAAYAVALYVSAVRGASFLRSRKWHWLDVLWAAALVGVSSTSFSLFFIFPILVASFRWGYWEGIKVSVVATACSFLANVTLASGALWPASPESLLRSLYLIVLGYLIARWAGSENLLKRRLILLKDLGGLRGRYPDSDTLIAAALDALTKFYQADVCLAAVSRFGGQPRLYASPGNGAATVAKLGEPAVAAQLLALPGECALIYAAAPRWMQGGQEHWHFLDESDNPLKQEVEREARAIVDILGARFCVSIPILQHEAITGRLCIGSEATRMTPPRHQGAQAGNFRQLPGCRRSDAGLRGGGIGTGRGVGQGSRRNENKEPGADRRDSSDQPGDPRG